MEERRSFDANFLLALVLCLLPTLIYVWGVRSRFMVIVFGICLSVPTVLAWLSYPSTNPSACWSSSSFRSRFSRR